MNVNEKYTQMEKKYFKLRKILIKCREENRRDFKELVSISGLEEKELINIEKGIDKDVIHFLMYAKALDININLIYKQNYNANCKFIK